MKRVTSFSNKLLLKFAVKSVLSSAILITALSFAVSEVLYKFDLNIERINIFALIIYVITAFLVSFISVSDFKNNGAILGIISQLPLIIFSLFNFFFGENSVLYFIIKLAVSLAFGALIGAVKTKKNSTYKV